MNSPFEKPLGQCALPPAFRAQFLFSADAPESLTLTGEMQRVWHRPVWLWPLFWFLSLFNILFPEQGQAVPAEMRIVGQRNRQQQPIHYWLRNFDFPNVRRYFNAAMIYDDGLQAVTEKLGPAGWLQMVWNVEFLMPNQIHISTRACFLALGPFKVRLASILYPSVQALETALGENVIHVNVEVSHAWFGAIFGYSGEFQLSRKTDGQ
ncbi:MAG: DUF4166 domain-containing protein [Anaerolineales bacterium]|nr:DUF4166 domain-containing protein [Anaerolineales bacterium]